MITLLLISTFAICYATRQHEFILAHNLGDTLTMPSRYVDGRERRVPLLFTSERISVPRSQDLALVESNNNTFPISRFPPNICMNPELRASEDYVGILPIGFGSDMPSQFDCVLLIPQNGRHVLLTNPVDVGAYCLNRMIQFVDSVNDANEFPVLISLQNETDVIAMRRTLALTAARYSKLPGGIYYPIRDAVGQMGCSTDVLEQLPSVRLTVAGSMVIEIFPEDYVEEIDGTCQLKIERSDWPTIGTNISKHLGIIIDYRNNRLGICDPI